MAASLGTNNFGYQNGIFPNRVALFLGYPMTQLEHMSNSHKQARDVIIGKKPTKEQIDSLNVACTRMVITPHAYILHRKDDDMVYFENSEMLLSFE